MKLIFNFNWGLMNQLPKKLQERCLEYFSESENWWIRESVARHPNTPAHVLEKLSGDEDWTIRNNVANHPNTPIHVLEKLSGDGGVRNRAKENLEKRK